MADMSVTVAGRNYRLACADGEEPHLKSLVDAVSAEADALVKQLRTAPEEGRLLLMTALVFADRRLEAAEAKATAEGALAEREADAAAEAEAGAAEKAEMGRRIGELETLLEQAKGEASRAAEAGAAAEARKSELETALAEANLRAAAAEEAVARATETTTGTNASRAARIGTLAERIETLTARLAPPAGTG